MKKLLLIASGMIILSSCDKSNIQGKTTNYKIGYMGDTLKLIQIEGCEYFYTLIDRGAIMCHKGNCKNAIHYKNK
jgi:hypothetical protein